MSRAGCPHLAAVYAGRSRYHDSHTCPWCERERAGQELDRWAAERDPSWLAPPTAGGGR